MGRNEAPRISFKTDLVNMDGEMHAHPCFKMEFTNKRIYSKENDGPVHFPEKELLRIEGLSDALADDPRVQAVTKYPIEEYQVHLGLFYAPVDVVPANYLAGDPVFGSLDKDILAEIEANRMDVVLLGIDPSTIYQPRLCSHDVNFYDVRRTYDDGRPCDKYVWPGRRIDTFIGNTGLPTTSGGKEHLDPEGIVLGRWPTEGYKPHQNDAQILERGNRNPRGIGRGGRGVAIFIRNGTYDVLLNTYRHMLADRDEELDVKVNGEKATAMVRVDSPHRAWLRKCYLSYTDAKKLRASENNLIEDPTEDAADEPEPEPAPDSDDGPDRTDNLPTQDAQPDAAADSVAVN